MAVHYNHLGSVFKNVNSYTMPKLLNQHLKNRNLSF